MKLIPINNLSLLQENDIFYTPKTLYDYHHRRKWPDGIFVKQGRKILLDIEKFRSVIQSS